MLCPSLRFYMQQKQDKLIHVNIRVAVSEVKYPSFLKFPTPESDYAFPKCSTHKGNEIWLLKTMEIVVHRKKFLDKKIRLRLPVLSGIPLHPKTSDYATLINTVCSFRVCVFTF